MISLANHNIFTIVLSKSIVKQVFSRQLEFPWMRHLKALH